MAIKIKYQNPISSDLRPDDIIINAREGTIFYKSEKGELFKLQGDNLSLPPTHEEKHFDSTISASKLFLQGTSGIGGFIIEGNGLNNFVIGAQPTLEVAGHILPSASAEPIYDIGSLEKPFRDFYLSEDSIRFVKKDKGVGFSKIGTTFQIGRYGFQNVPKKEEETEFTKLEVKQLKSSSITEPTGDITASRNIKAELGNFLNLRVVNDITASGNISCSGTVIADAFQSLGEDDQLNFSDHINITGNITASGTIATSASIFTPTLKGEGGTTELFVDGFITASNNITSSGGITASSAYFRTDVTASGTIKAEHFYSTDDIVADGEVQGANVNAQTAASGYELAGTKYLYANGVILTLGQSSTAIELNGSTCTLDVTTIKFDASSGMIHFQDSGTDQLTLDMDGTAGAQVIQLKVSGDDLIFKAQDGSTLLTLKSEGQTEVGGDLSSGGTILSGWHGSTTRIKILVSDFIPDDIGRPAMIDDTGSDRWLESHGTGKLFASIPIPTGFKATHVHIYGSATSAVTVYEADINSKTVTSKGTGNIGTEINITDVTSDTTNYLFIELAQASGEEVYGGYVTIATV